MPPALRDGDDSLPPVRSAGPVRTAGAVPVAPPRRPGTAPAGRGIGLLRRAVVVARAAGVRR